MNPRPFSFAVALAALLLALVALAGCKSGGLTASEGSDSSEAAEVGKSPATLEAPPTPAPSTLTGRVVVLSSRDEAASAGVWALVRERHPGIELTVKQATDAEHLETLKTSAKAPSADLFVSSESLALLEAGELGLLAPLPQPVLEQVAPGARGREGRWLALTLTARIVIARRLLGNKPLTVLDLAEPRFQARVARTTVADDHLVTSVATLVGDRGPRRTETFLTGLADNTAVAANVYEDDAEVLDAVVQRKADIALIDHVAFYAHLLGAVPATDVDRELAEKKVAESALVAIFPDNDQGGVAWSAAGAGLVTGSSNEEAALAVLDVLLSESGQQALTWPTREYPAVLELAPPPGLLSTTEFQWSTAPLSTLGPRWDAALDLMAAAGVK